MSPVPSGSDGTDSGSSDCAIEVGGPQVQRFQDRMNHDQLRAIVQWGWWPIKKTYYRAGQHFGLGARRAASAGNLELRYAIEREDARRKAKQQHEERSG